MFRTVPLALHKGELRAKIDVAFCKNIYTTILVSWPKPDFVTHFAQQFCNQFFKLARRKAIYLLRVRIDVSDKSRVSNKAKVPDS